MKKIQIFTLLILLIILNSSSTNAYSIAGSYTDTSNLEEPFSKYEGKVLLVEAFATGCSHCQSEHKELVKLWDKYNGTINLLSLSVSEDDSLDKIKEYLVKYPSSWDMGFDQDFDFRNKYGIKAFPSLLLFTVDGEVASCHVGERSFSDLSSDVDSLISDSKKFIEKKDSSCELDPLNQFLQSPLFVFLFLGALTLSVYTIIKYVKNKS